MREARRFVVDASVVVKWHLHDEDFVQPALALLRNFEVGTLDLVAPLHVEYEVSSAIRNAVRTRRISPTQGRAAIENLFALDLPTVHHANLILAGYDEALRFGCSVYDGLYLALAEAARCAFVYADQRLRNTLAGRFPLAVWIEDCPG
jgi:predicted nucleic acid-binding protein